jgi:flagellin
MGLRINNNVAAMNAYRNLSVTDAQQQKSLERLSSGYRINRAADDAAGLSISEGMRSQIGGLKVSVRNAQDGISVVQTAEGALNETTSILQRMRDLAVQAANVGVQDTAAQQAAGLEVSQLTSELDRIAQNTKFGSQAMLSNASGSAWTGTFQVGSNSGQVITVAISGMTAAALNINSTNVSLVDNTGVKQSTAISYIDAALSAVSAARANLGAFQNRFEHAVNNINTTVENLTASESRIRDTDMAQEMVNFTRTQILSQAGTSMLSQANQSQQGVLSLLRG